MGIFEKLMKWMAEYYAKERGGIGWRWQAMDSKHSAAPLGGEKTGKSPTDRGKLGAKMNLLVDGRGAPISVVLTGANRHAKVSAVDLIVSMIPKRPAHKEQHLCADKAYRLLRLEGIRCLRGLHRSHQDQSQEERCRRRGGGASAYRGVCREGLSGQEVESRAHDFMVEQVPQPPYSLVQEG
jgi:putative transposase